MTDVAGVVFGVVTLWNSCVQIFDTIDLGKTYGIDYEVLRVKLEVERIRLLTWGDAVGLSEVEHGRPSLDPRINRVDIRNTVLRLLGCIQHVFEHTERLQERYGLRPVMVDEEGPPTQSQLILGSIFKRASETLRKAANHRQRSTPLQKKTLWAIHDKKKFQAMVSEVKGFNDNLESLFPDIKRYTSDNIRNEIDQSEDVDALLSLQQATSDEHDDISESASVRLEAMGVTATARSRISDDQETVSAENHVTLRPERANDFDNEAQSSEELDEVSKKMQTVERYVSGKNEGALTLSLLGPQIHSACVSAHVYWDSQRSDDTWSHWDDQDKGFVKSLHASFDLYRRKRFIKKPRRENADPYTDEDDILLDVESKAKYENANPGTVTVEGFGMECWDYEEKFGKPRKNTVFVSHADLPSISDRKLLRRIDELRRDVHRFGRHPEQEEAHLKEFFGDMGVTRYGTGNSHTDESFRISDFYSMLNRRGIFADFTAKSTIALVWGGTKKDSIGIWNFLWQVILAKELALRLEHIPDPSVSGFTSKVLASLIVQDLWLRNVGIILVDAKVFPNDLKKAESSEERAKAEEYKSKGNKAMQTKQWQAAVDLYTEAMKIDLSNAIYRCNRSAALLAMEKHEESRHDAYITTQLDPKYAKGWARLGLAEMKFGNGNKARDAYERAIEIAGKDATSLMEQGLADAQAKIKADLEAIEKETDKTAKDVLWKNYLDQDWDTACKTPQLHSHVHEQQVEGLLLFAQRMKWPYINEVRDYAEDVYGNLCSGQSVPLHLYDWLFGMVLPGKWMSFKIMAALVLCTPSISTSLGVAYYYDCGVSLAKHSYWRVRTVLGRVLGCLPGLISLCGWVGPCPPMEFVPPLSEEAKKKPRYVHLKARHVAPIESTIDDEDGVVVFRSHHGRYEATRMQPDEDIPAYLAEMKDDGKWVIPERPVRELSTCTVQSIRLKKLPLDINVAAKKANKKLSDQEVDDRTEYRASIIFHIDNNEDPVTYTLYTNPVFVTLPPCHPGPKGPHEVHLRELPMYQKNAWTVDRLKDHTPEDFDEDVMVINATGKGAEALARAWCSERGKNAVIRRVGGPCFVCAVRGASKAGLGVGVLIWVS